MEVKVDYKKEIRYIFSLVASSILLGVIFCAVWVVKKFKDGAI